MEFNSTRYEMRAGTMELYFKDLETEDGASDLTLSFSGTEVTEEHTDTAEEAAFAELAERVSAARLVY